MTKFSFNQAVPFEATHVGEVIKDELSARNMKQSELSGLTGIQRPILNDVIKGKRSLTPEMALLPQFRSIILCDLLLYIDVTFWYLSIDLGLFWGSWFLHRHKIPHPNQWGT